MVGGKNVGSIISRYSGTGARAPAAGRLSSRAETKKTGLQRAKEIKPSKSVDIIIKAKCTMAKGRGLKMDTQLVPSLSS